MSTAHGYAAQTSDSPLRPHTFERRELRANDVLIEILHSGVCHSDLHAAHNDWDGTIYADGTVYPCVPGHEIVGRVVAMGSAATRFRIGEIAGVGNLVDSCQQCSACLEGLEQHCANQPTWTYNAPDRITGANTLGGYSDFIVVREEFALKVRHDEQDLAAVAPLLCAGITMWSPLRHWKAGPGTSVSVVGIGGLGHIGVKLAHALGAHVVAFTTSEHKRADAFDLGADEVVNSRNPDEMAAQQARLDLILNSIAVKHQLDPFLNLLKLNGTMTLVGVPAESHPAPSVATLVGQRRSLSGSLVGGLAETQELLDFSAQLGILADVETIAMDQIEKAFARMLDNDVKYRFVIDMKSSQPPTSQCI